MSRVLSRMGPAKLGPSEAMPDSFLAYREHKMEESRVCAGGEIPICMVGEENS